MAYFSQVDVFQAGDDAIVTFYFTATMCHFQYISS